MTDKSDSLIVSEDGSLELGDSIEKIVFHQNLNVFLVLTKENTIRVFDPHSSHKLADVPLAKYVTDPEEFIKCMYHSETGAIVLSGDKSLGIRHHHQGVLLLNTILQTQVTSSDEVVTLEILLSEALQLQQVLWELNNIENVSELKEAIAQAISEPQSQTCTNPKVGKWRTVCLTLPLGTLRRVFTSLVSELRNLAYFIPVLSLASALVHRLHHLSPSLSTTDDSELDKDAMFSEAARLATFNKWPHMNYKWALPEQMAQAGFFYQPVTSDDDRATCFICNVCLVYWEPTDEPWSEHERHSPSCPYVKGEYTHNVPLSVTHASTPAFTHSDKAENIYRISQSNSNLFLATATKTGNIVIWNIAKQWKKEVSFMIDPSHSTILDKHFSDTIGYTDSPLRPESPEQIYLPFKSSTLKHMESAAKSYSMYSNMMSPLNGNINSEKLMKEDLDNSLSQLFDDMPSDIHSLYTDSSPSEANPKKWSKHKKYLVGIKPIMPIDELNDIESLNLEEVLQLENLMDEEAQSDNTNENHTNLQSSNQIGHNVSDPKSKFMTKKVEFQVENISDELFAPPRPSHDVRVTSLCIITEPYSLSISFSSGNSTKYKNACLAVGVGLRRYDLFSNSNSDSLVQALNSFNQNTSKDKKPLDIMKLEKNPETQVKDNECQYVDESSSNQEDYSCNSNPKNFVPYLLIYDLSQLVQAQNMHSKQNSVAKSVQQGSSKKSTRKTVPNSSSLVKVKGDMDIDVDINFSVKYSKIYKSVPHNIPNEKLSTSKKVPKCIQCIPLPHKLNKLRLQLFVDLILISSCGQYLLISLKQFPKKNLKETDKETQENSKTSDVNNSSSADNSSGAHQENKAVCGGFILYKIIVHEGSVLLLEEPVASNLFTDCNLVAKEIVMIPDVVFSDIEDEGAAYMAGVICVDGSLRILSLYSLEYVQVIKPTDAKFSNISYCHSLERLCVTREDGKVLLMQVKGREDMSDDAEFVENETAPRSTSNFNSSISSKTESTGDFDKGTELLINKPLNEENLDKCIELIQFEPGCPKFVATVPPCWTEVIQAQKKRRNPQHLQHQSEEIDSARTWRLESDRSFFDEHILDILLPHKSTSGSSGSMQIGHIDVRLNFVNGATQNLPKIQITLLKQNLKSSSKSKNLPNILDEYSDDLPENPVLTREFLLAHKAEILCGPVTVNNFIDLSGQAANLTLTSPDLFASKGRSFLIHIKVVNKKKEDKSESDCNLDLLPQYVPPQSNTFFDKLSSSTASLKRGEAPKGCEVIQELTLTIHCCARTSIPSERLQRLSMIENDNFHSNLITTIVNPSSSQHSQHRAFDVLLWVLSIHTTSDHKRARRKGLVSQILENLNGFVRSCILYGDRSWAHKMTKIILTVLESYSDPDERKEFGSRVLTCLLEYLDGIVKCKAAGAVYWYFSLLNHVKWCDPLTTADKITEFLSFTSEALSQRIHPVYSLLQTRFGLYGLPFERDLFDTFPPLLMKQNSSVSGNSNPGTTTHGHQHSNSTSSNGNNNFNNSQHPYFINKFDHPNFLWNSSNSKGYFEGMFSSLGGDNSDLGIILGQNGVTLGLTPQIGGLCGLFEVEPLHFSLHLASDGTKMERVFSGLTNYSTIPYIIQPTSSVDSDFSLTIDNSKWNSLVTPTNQLNKALEDMEHMVMKNHAVAMLLSKKAKKSYSEKLKKAAKLKADLKKALHLSSSFNPSSISVTTTTTSSGQNAHNDSLTADGDFNKTASSSSTSSTLSSDTSPEGLPPTSTLIGKPQMKNTNNSDILGDIVEDVGTILFSTSVLNNSLSLLADVTQDVTESLLQPESDSASDKLVEQVYSQSGIDKENYQSNQFFSKLFDYLLPDSPEEQSNGTLSNGHHIPSFSKNNDNKIILGNLEKKIESVLSNQETDKDKLIEKNLAEELSSPASGKTSTTSTTSTLTKEAKDSGTSIEEMIYKKSQFPTSGLPYQQLLSIPPQQMIVVERMHSGARRFVILDFGAPVVLTDVIIPACSDLVSLTIDIWLKGEETDGERLAVASDIGLRPLVLADLQPPPLCRYLKVTTLGRYGMVTSQCKIPVGAFYGHTVIMPWYIQPYHSNVTVTTKKMAKTQLAILSNMVEDVSCRYSLACSKLKSLLQPHCISSNSEARLAHSLNSCPSTLADSVQEKKILLAYHECMTEQHHLNLILSVMRRLQKFIGVSPSNDLHRTTAGSGNTENITVLNGHSNNSADYRKELESCSSDQLSIIVQSLLNCLLTLSFPPPNSCVQMKLLSWCGPDQAKALIGNVCIRGPKGAQVAVVSLLARLCSGQPWWGEFLATTLVSLFSSRESSEFPATRLFALLTFLGQKSVQCGRGTQVIDAVLQSLLRSTPSADDENPVNQQYSWMFNGASRQIDPALISWLLLFLSLCLDLITNTKGGDDERGREGGRWSWLTAESSLQKKSSDTTKEAPRDSRDLLRKRLVHHKQQLVNLDAATKSFDEVLTSLGNVINPKMFKQSEQVFKKIQKQHALKHYKDLCSIQRNETNSLRRLSRNKGNTMITTKSKTNKDDMCSSVTTELIAPVDRECCLAVIKNLIRLLMNNAQYFSSVDTFLLTCKVIGGLVRVTRPSLKVSEFLNDEQLVMLLSHSMTLDTTWGSPWAMHALQCLLQDVLEGERLYGSIIIGVQSGEETNVTDNSKGGHSGDALCCDIVVETPSVSQSSSATSNVCSSLSHPHNNCSQEDIVTQDSCNNNSNKANNNNQNCEFVNTMDNEESTLLSQQISLEQSGDIADSYKAIKNDKILSENENVSAIASVSKSVVSPSGSVNQSATAVSPPAVNIATSHFATIEEEETAGEITFLESDDSSCSNDIIEYLSDLKSDLILLVDQHNTHYTGQTLQNKHGGTKDSRVGDLLTASLATQKGKMGTDHSTAVDARLENGISLTAELRIHMMNAIHASKLRSAISAPLQAVSSSWNEESMYGSGNLKESVKLLADVFEKTLSHLSYKFEGNQLESLLEIWLNLNLSMAEGEYNPAIIPSIPLYPQSISTLLSAVARSQSISIRCWCLLLQTLTLCSNLTPEEGTNGPYFPPTNNHQDQFSSSDLYWMSRAIICDSNFIVVLQKLLSGHFTVGTITRSDVVGSSLTNFLEDLLLRLEVRCDVLSPNSGPGSTLKLTLLTLVMRLLQEPDGPLARGSGPLDIQKTFLTLMLSLNYNGLHKNKTHIPIAIINSVANVVNGFLRSNQEIMSGSPEPNTSVLGGLFASVLGGPDGQQGPIPTRRTILCTLLNLARKLIEVPLEPSTKSTCNSGDSTISSPSGSSNGNSYQERYLTDSVKLEQKHQLGLSSNTTSSQTDEHKALNPLNSPSTTPVEDSSSDFSTSSGNTRNIPERNRPRANNSNILRTDCAHTEEKVACLADLVLQNHETMQMLLESLKSSESNSPVPMNLIGMVSGDVSERLGIGKTLPDALYHLLVTLNQKTTKNELLLNSLLRFIRPDNILCQPNFSEALYCFFIQVLDCEGLLKKFSLMHGTELIWENLVKSTDTSCGLQNGFISSVMNHLSPPLPPSTTSSTSHKRIDPSTGSPSTVESSNPKGLYNFAPLAVVTSSNPTARPADSLVKSSQFFQRTKSPPWSYHFYPEENWIDLNFTLPCPILLHEIQLQPHTMSLGMCPSGLSLETGIEGGCLIPVTGLVCTAGLTCIHIALQHPVVASVIVIRLHRPRDQSTLGLSHLKLLGTTTFKNSLKCISGDSSWDPGSQKSSYWWLRLVDHCMFDVPGGLNIMMESGTRIQGVMEAMVTLLATSSIQPAYPQSATSLNTLSETLVDNNNYQLIHTLSSTLIENTTLALVNYNQDLLHSLIRCLFSHPFMMQESGFAAVDAAIALLCVVSNANEGVKFLIDWFSKMVEYRSSLPSDESSTSDHRTCMNPKILHCFAAILWNIPDDVSSLVTDSLFKKVYDWCEKSSGPIKEGLNYIICSLCKVRPHLFTQLMLFMGFLTVIDSTTSSITDDRKDREAELRASCTDDMKESSEGCGLSGEGRLILQDPSVISITPSHLQTISFAAQSSSTIHLMLDSGFPLLLVHGILEWCKAELLHQVESCTTPNVKESSTDLEKASVSNLGVKSSEVEQVNETTSQSLSIPDALPPLSTGMVVHILEALASMCSEASMRDWLGSGEGSVFWVPLLTVLGDPVMYGSEISVRTGYGCNYSDYSKVEDATIQLMKVCCSNHDQNRKLLAATLCQLIQRQNTPPPGGLTYLHSLSGFTRRLVLQILLEKECVLVHVTSTFCLSQPPLHTLPPQIKHPKYGTGNKTRLMFLPVTTKIEEVIRMVTDWWQQGTTTQPSQSQSTEGTTNADNENGSYKKEISEVGLELVDKLSVAAGVTAKDKRMKDKWSIKVNRQKNKKKDSSQPKRYNNEKPSGGGQSTLPSYGLLHELILGGSSVVPESMTLGQVLAALWHHSPSTLHEVSHLKFSLVFAKDACQEPVESPVIESLIKTDPQPSILNVFSSQGGLSILAQHMALLYPDTSHQYVSSISSKSSREERKEKSVDEDMGFHVDMQYSMLPDYYSGNSITNSPGIAGSSALSYFGMMPIPPHSLGSFTLFLRLPGYAETLLTDHTKACCLLRLALGVYDSVYDGEASSFITSLATLPFQVLELLLKSTPLTTDDGIMLRKMCLTTGVLHLILACLAVLSHHDGPDVIKALHHPNIPVSLLVATARGSCPSQKQSDTNNRNDNERSHYWAKGTGFGTGSTNQSWNVEQAFIKQKLEEQHVVWLIKLLAQYINPGDTLSEDLKSLCEEELNNMSQSTQDCDYSTPNTSSTQAAAAACLSTDASSSSLKTTLPDESGPCLPVELFELLQKAGLINKISSYLSNDSVLDMSRHVPLYQALMSLVRAIAVTPSLAPLFNSSTKIGLMSASDVKECDDDQSKPVCSSSLPFLLSKMKKTVNTYMAKLKWKAGKVGGSDQYRQGNRKVPNNNEENSSGVEMKDYQNANDETENEDQGLSLLVPDIQLSTKVVEIIMERLKIQNEENSEKSIQELSEEDASCHLSATDVYLNAMKPLQFDSYEMIIEDADRGFRFVIPYHYESLVRDAGEVFNPKRMKRLAQEAVTLSTSLPLSYSSSVFVRTDMDRLDVMKVLITGPEDTPYANGCFEFDVYFPNFYPNSPLYINLQTTGEKRVRFNPNLYQDGKVCLSILNTWHGRPEEKWNPQTSSLLQVLVSIQSLILVPEPYFNEPGYERSRGSQAALHNSQEYDANIKAATIRWAILNQLRNPSPCFKEVIERHFWLKRKDIMQQVESWITELDELAKNKRAGKAIPHHALAIKKLHQLLEDDFRKMVPPKDLEQYTIITPSNSVHQETCNTGVESFEDEVKDHPQTKQRHRKTSRADIFAGSKLPVINEWGKKSGADSSKEGVQNEDSHTDMDWDMRLQDICGGYLGNEGEESGSDNSINYCKNIKSKANSETLGNNGIHLNSECAKNVSEQISSNNNKIYSDDSGANNSQLNDNEPLFGKSDKVASNTFTSSSSQNVAVTALTASETSGTDLDQQQITTSHSEKETVIKNIKNDKTGT